MPRTLKPEELYKRCNSEDFDFQTTEDLHPLDGTIGQLRALKALDFGLDIERSGFNIFMLGENGTGKLTTIKSLLSKRAEGEPVPEDWCYVHNFKDPDVPQAMSLAPGKAVRFKKDMDTLVEILRVEIPKVFESKEYEKQKSGIVEEFQKNQKDLFGKLEDKAKAKGFSIRKTVSGLVVVPVKKGGDPLSEEEFEALEPGNKEKVEEVGKGLQERLDDVVRTLREKEKSVKDKMAGLERDAALSAVGHLIDEIKVKYRGYKDIAEYLEAVKEDIFLNIEDFKAQEAEAPPLPFMKAQKSEPTFTRYMVNVLVNNQNAKGAPCVFENNPTYNNLFGRIEHKVQYGMALTDLTMIKAGSLHQANGGYIVINALDLLKNIFSYDALKRAIRNREVKVEDVWEQYRPVSTAALTPQSIPLDVKVVLLGTPHIYYLLYNLDDEYRELFKVKADFDNKMQRTPDNISKYAEFVAAGCQREGLLPFDRTGVARVVEYGCRLAGHQEKLSSRFSAVADIIRESHYWAQKAESPIVTDGHVETALNEKIFRNNKYDEMMRELMVEDTLIVETSGQRAGQVNGLAVLSIGDFDFGKPSRITANSFIGKAGVVNIERETKMSGKIHEKAILILSNYLGAMFAQKAPISLSASITFEQLYDMVEGDSATCAELYALLSSISQVPLKQGIAVTGSMDQNGQVQPIGGVNEKIEGFFDLCDARGLDGTQGVIIPSRNLKHLMLKKSVVDAVQAGKFTIYSIERVHEGLEILTGMPAGELGKNNKYPRGSINALVAKRLEEISEAMKPQKAKTAKPKKVEKKKTAKKQ